MGLPATPVDVGTDGREIQEPPKGSYAAQELTRQQEWIERQRIDQAAAAVPPEVVPPVDPTQPVNPNGEDGRDQGSINARFQQLTQRNRESETARQEAEQKLVDERAVIEREREDFARQRQGYEQAMAEHLDDLPPEERARIVTDARHQELAARTRDEITSELLPQIRDLQADRQYRELMALADKYPGFDNEVHGPLIADFMGKNHACSIESAFRAVATNDEIGLQPVSRPRIPTAVPVRGTNGSEMIAPAPQPDPQDNLREEARKLHELAHSRDPKDQREHARLMQEHLGRRLS